jgi:hypothetical protein
VLQIVLIGIGAGLAAALLFAAPLSGAGVAFPLFALTGLPIALAGIGWTLVSGIIAAVVGASIVLLMFSPSATAIFLLIFCLPLLWTIRYAALSRPLDENDPASPREWYPVGRLLLHLTLAAAVGIVLTGVIVGYDPARLATQMVESLAGWFADSGTATPPGREQLEAFVQFNIAAMPATVAIIIVTVLVIDLFLAAAIARMSGRAMRPRDRIWTVALPRPALIGFGAAIVLALLPGPIGDVARVFAGALGCAVAMVGLAVLHALTLGNAARSFVLFGAYALLFVFGFPIFIFALLGIAESAFHLRARRFGNAPPPTT